MFFQTTNCNKSKFFVYIMYTVYIYYIYLNTHLHFCEFISVFLLNIPR